MKLVRSGATVPFINVLDHVSNVRDVQTTRGDIRGDENSHAVLLEILQRPFALLLRPVSVDGGGFIAVVYDLVHELAGRPLLGDKHKGLALDGAEGLVQWTVFAVVAAGVNHALLDALDGRAYPPDGNPDVTVPVHGDRPGHRCV